MSMAALKTYLGDRLLRDEPLSKYTAARLGGPADFVVIVKDSLDDLIEVVSLAWAAELPVRILGGGANVLISDQGIHGLVIVNHVSEIRTGEWHDGRTVSATSGVSLTVLANKCQAMGYSGLEWAISVPGTVGGAIVNNAGAHGSDMSESVADVVVLEKGKGPELYTCADLNYGYRTSMLKHREGGTFLVLLATLMLPPENPKTIKERMEHFRSYRKETQPPGASLGSIFKNPEGDYAGRLIESVGLKGYKIGHAMVSPVHANFFINDGGKATSTDYYALIKHVQESVKTQTGVLLEPEIQFVGMW